MDIQGILAGEASADAASVGEVLMAREAGLSQLYFLEKSSYNHVKIVGIHVHLKSQELDADVLVRYYENILKLAAKVQDISKCPLGFINMGSGKGIPYSATDSPLDVIEQHPLIYLYG